MRAVVQRVSAAWVEVEGRTISRIGPGLVAFVAVENGDGPAEVRWMADKLVHLRLFAGQDGRLDRSVLEVGGSVLLVSNFTVAGDCRKGRRPAFDRAAPGGLARAWFSALVTEVAGRGVPCLTGQFGASMRVVVENDGPVTVVVSSGGS